MSFASPTKPLGPNNPLNKNKSTAVGDAASRSLLTYIDTKAPLEDEVEQARRETVLNDMQTLLVNWVQETAVEKGLFPNKESASHIYAQIYVSGSYRLGFNDPGGDIDTVCVCPSFVTVHDFFSTFLAKLEALPGVTEVKAIKAALAPIIEILINNINIDMGFARIPSLQNIPKDLNILDDKILRDASKSEVVMLNGPRVTELIPHLVPNFEVFKVVVRSLRLWARKRGIYSNKMGYFGGVNLNILAAYGCQLFPNYSAAPILLRLFHVLQYWDWPKPLFIASPDEDSTLNFDVWDPTKHMENRRDIMPIITPAYPSSNSSYNVSLQSLEIIQREFVLAFDNLRSIFNDLARFERPDQTGPLLPSIVEEINQTIQWDKLFEHSDFFIRFNSYLIIEIEATNEVHLAHWQGWVESRLRTLISYICDDPARKNTFAALFPKGFRIEKEITMLPETADSSKQAGTTPIKKSHTTAIATTEEVPATSTTAPTTSEDASSRTGPAAAEGVEKSSEQVTESSETVDGARGTVPPRIHSITRLVEEASGQDDASTPMQLQLVRAEARGDASEVDPRLGNVTEDPAKAAAEETTVPPMGGAALPVSASESAEAGPGVETGVVPADSVAVTQPEEDAATAGTKRGIAALDAEDARDQPEKKPKTDGSVSANDDTPMQIEASSEEKTTPSDSKVADKSTEAREMQQSSEQENSEATVPAIKVLRPAIQYFVGIENRVVHTGAPKRPIDISEPIKRFMDYVRSKYNGNVAEVGVRAMDTKWKGLPDFVFPKGKEIAIQERQAHLRQIEDAKREMVLEEAATAEMVSQSRWSRKDNPLSGPEASSVASPSAAAFTFEGRDAGSRGSGSGSDAGGFAVPLIGGAAKPDALGRRVSNARNIEIPLLSDSHHLSSADAAPGAYSSTELGRPVGIPGLKPGEVVVPALGHISSPSNQQFAVDSNQSNQAANRSGPTKAPQAPTHVPIAQIVPPPPKLNIARPFSKGVVPTQKKFAIKLKK